MQRAQVSARRIRFSPTSKTASGSRSTLTQNELQGCSEPPGCGAVPEGLLRMSTRRYPCETLQWFWGRRDASLPRGLALVARKLHRFPGSSWSEVGNPEVGGSFSVVAKSPSHPSKRRLAPICRLASTHSNKADSAAKPFPQQRQPVFRRSLFCERVPTRIDFFVATLRCEAVDGSLLRRGRLHSRPPLRLRLRLSVPLSLAAGERPGAPASCDGSRLRAGWIGRGDGLERRIRRSPSWT